MKEVLEKIIIDWIWSIVSNSSLSIDKQTRIIYNKLKKYNYEFLDISRNITNISEDFCKRMIYDFIRKEEWAQIQDFYRKVISEIADKIIEKKAKELF